MFIFIFPFVCALERGLLVPGLKIDEIVLVLCLVGVSLDNWNKISFSLNKVDYVFFLIIFTGLASQIICAIYRGWPLPIGELLSFFKGYIIYRIVYRSISTHDEVNKTFWLLIFSGLLVSLIGLLQIYDVYNMRHFLSVIYPDSTAFSLLRDDVQNLSATSTIGDKNALGGYLSLVIILLVFSRKILRLNKILYSAVISFSFVGLAMSGSSSAILSLLIALMVYSFFAIKIFKISNLKYIFFSIILLFIISIASYDVIKTQVVRQFDRSVVVDRASGDIVNTYGLPGSLVVRGYLLIYLSDMILDDKISLLFGFGRSEAAMELLPWGSPEIGYLYMIYHFGIFFLFANLYLFVFFIKRYFKLNSTSFMTELYSSQLLKVVFVASVFNVSANLIYPYYVSAGVSHLFFILIGLSTAVSQFKKRYN